MGKRSRRRQRQRGERGQARRQTGRGGGSSGGALTDLVTAATIASWHRDPAARDELLRRLAGRVDGADSVELARAVAGPMLRAVGECWHRGWQPLDLAHTTRRRLGATHRRVCTDVIAVHALGYHTDVNADPAWLDQLRALTPFPRGVDADSLLGRWAHRSGGLWRAVETAVETLGLLLGLPSLPRLRPPPAEWGRCPPAAAAAAAGCDPKVIARVRALLAKAESTSFPEEAEAFTAKAQELVTRHAIDRTLLDQGRAGGGTASEVAGRRVLIDDPYGAAKMLLLAEIGEANRCRSVWSADLGFGTVFGAPADLDAVELLFASLLTQGSAAMTSRAAMARYRTRSFRQSFLVAFAGRIGERLRGATAQAVDDAVSAHGDRFLPVLAAGEQAAESARQAAYGDLVARTISAADAAGFAAGRMAADLAHLGPRHQLEAEAEAS